MKSLKIALLGTCAMAMFAGTASADGFYVGIDAGVGFPTFSKVKYEGNKYNFKLNTGFVGDVVAGYAFSNNLRAELDFGYRYNSLKKVGGTKVKGHLNTYALTANLLYDFKNSTNFTPFVGLGAGFATNYIKDKTVDKNKTSTKFAGLGTVGLSYNITDAFKASLAYRFFASWGHRTPLSGKYDMYNHEILLGLRYEFGAKCKAKSTSSDIAAIPDENLANHMVFFALDSAEITPEATETLKTVAEEFKEGKDVTLKLTGHTDLTGTPEYNLKLSNKRAKSAKAALVEMGIPADKIVTKGVGMKNPLISTALGVLEPQNRRVVLEFVE